MNNSEENEDPLVEKILLDLENAIVKHPLLSDFDMVLSESKTNKSPVIRHEEHLGLESWCVKRVYLHVHNKLIVGRNRKTTRLMHFYDQRRFSRLLLAAVLLNGDVPAFWNMRRQYILDNQLNFKFEMKISDLVLSYKPKCNEAFMFRKWVIQHAIKQNMPEVKMGSDQFSVLIADELSVATAAAEKYKNNYHAFNYQFWIVKLCVESLRSFPELMAQVAGIVVTRQLSITSHWMTTHVSDHSVFHYRQQLISLLQTCPAVRLDDTYVCTFKTFFKGCVPFNMDKLSIRQIMVNLLGKPPPKSDDVEVQRDFKCLCNTLMILFTDLVTLCEANSLCSCHETIWYHRRYLLSTIFRLVYDYYGAKLDKSSNVNGFLKCTDAADDAKNIVDAIKLSDLEGSCTRATLSPGDVPLCKALIANERREMEYCSIFSEQMRFVERHKKWLMLNLRVLL